LQTLVCEFLEIALQEEKVDDSMQQSTAANGCHTKHESVHIESATAFTEGVASQLPGRVRVRIIVDQAKGLQDLQTLSAQDPFVGAKLLPQHFSSQEFKCRCPCVLAGGTEPEWKSGALQDHLMSVF
jgi:hypothetical protein